MVHLCYGGDSRADAAGGELVAMPGWSAAGSYYLLQTEIAAVQVGRVRFESIYGKLYDCHPSRS